MTSQEINGFFLSPSSFFNVQFHDFVVGNIYEIFSGNITFGWTVIKIIFRIWKTG